MEQEDELLADQVLIEEGQVLNDAGGGGIGKNGGVEQMGGEDR